MLCTAAHTNQANSRSHYTEKKTWLFLLHVRARMERVLFITCLYSDWISRFNSMLVHDCMAAGWAQGFELWLFQKRTGSGAACQSAWRPKSSARRTQWQQVPQYKPFFASQTLCLVLKISGNIWSVTSELHDKQLWKVHNSCLCSHPASMLLSRVWVVCVSQKKWFNDKLCIYFYLRFFFLQGVHCSVFVITVNQCFNHYLYITAF